MTDVLVVIVVDIPEGIRFTAVMGPMSSCKYPSRKTRDIYVLDNWEAKIPIKCCQPDCQDSEFGYEELVAHLEVHAPRRDKRLFR